MGKIDELKWQAESDAETMARYQEIISDKNRLNRATKAAKQKVQDLTKRANMMSKAASNRKKK